MRNKQYILFFGFILITTFFLLYDQKNLNDKIISELDDSVRKKKEFVSFDKISDDFDSLMVMGCYANTRKVEEDYGIDLNSTGIIQRDDVILLVPLKNRQIVQIVYLQVYKYYTDISPPKIFPKNYRFKLYLKSGVIHISE